MGVYFNPKYVIITYARNLSVYIGVNNSTVSTRLRIDCILLQYEATIVIFPSIL